MVNLAAGSATMRWKANFEPDARRFEDGPTTERPFFLASDDGPALADVLEIAVPMKHVSSCPCCSGQRGKGLPPPAEMAFEPLAPADLQGSPEPSLAGLHPPNDFELDFGLRFDGRHLAMLSGLVDQPFL